MNMEIISYEAEYLMRNSIFHSSKKGQCEMRLEYKNATEEEKKNIEGKYNKHIREKKTRRIM